MKREAGVGAVVVALGLAWGLAFAAVASPVVPPKGTEGPDIHQKIEPKGVEGPDVRLVARVAPKGIQGPDVQDTLPPMGLEGPGGR